MLLDDHNGTRDFENTTDESSSESTSCASDYDTECPPFCCKKGWSASESTSTEGMSEFGEVGTTYTDADRRAMAKYMSRFEVDEWARMKKANRWEEFRRKVSAFILMNL